MSSLDFNLGFAGRQENVGYKFKDIRIPLRIQRNSYDFVENLDEKAIIDGINNIFSWRRGERILNPEFGINFLEYLYEPINNITAQTIVNDIKLALQLYEPRIVVNKVHVVSNEDKNEYNITIAYSIPAISKTDLQYRLNISGEN
jgi:phage baseplate assembly protein W